MSRKAFSRLSEDARRSALIRATLACVAEHGLDGAGARQIAAQAGVSAGLIRHYFASKEALIHAAYAFLMGEMTGEAARSAEGAGAGGPDAALARFLAANVSPPNLSGVKVTLWASFIGRVRADPAYREIHRAAYGEFLEILEGLIHPVLVDVQDQPHALTTRQLAISINGLIDGLWLEGSLDHGAFAAHELPEIVLAGAEGLLGLPAGQLARHAPPAL